MPDISKAAQLWGELYALLCKKPELQNALGSIAESELARLDDLAETIIEKYLDGMNMCEECGLPIKACNALASYRYAIERVRQGNMVAAFDFANTAKTFHDAYLEEHKALARD